MSRREELDAISVQGEGSGEEGDGGWEEGLLEETSVLVGGWVGGGGWMDSAYLASLSLLHSTNHPTLPSSTHPPTLTYTS